MPPEDMGLYFNGSLGKTIDDTSPDTFPPEINVGDILNPFKQPNDRSMDWYGSGDVDNDGDVDRDDYASMVLGTQDDRSDVNGDGLVDAQDQLLLQSYLNSTVSFLPGWWNQLQTGEERESWLEKMLVIDLTDTNTWVHGTIEQRFISVNYGTLLALNFLDTKN